MNRHQHTTGTALAGLVIGVVIGLGVGVYIAAPSITDWRNACVADKVVPHAGTPGIAPGYADPRTIPSTPQPDRGPYPRHRGADAPATTAQVVTPLVRP